MKKEFKITIPDNSGFPNIDEDILLYYLNSNRGLKLDNKYFSSVDDFGNYIFTDDYSDIYLLNKEETIQNIYLDKEILVQFLKYYNSNLLQSIINV